MSNLLRSIGFWTVFMAATSGYSPVFAVQEALQKDDQAEKFFESNIRPVLIEKCLSCHAADTEQSGGLLLDSKVGWQAGGDQGPAIVPGRATESLIWKAISYADPMLQMPPDGKLPDEVIAAFKYWIDGGAYDPRAGEATKPKTHGLPVSEAQSHWSYRPIDAGSLRSVGDALPVGQAVDRWVLRGLADKGLEIAPAASPAVQVRRLFYDLIGLPPTVEQLEYWTTDFDEVRYQQLVDHLLASPHFGEAFARRWMDVVRYADSVTLRGFVYGQAWRYRDYLIDAYNQDKSFQELICEQIAGDLMSAKKVAQRQQQLVATGFLALGNTNLEKQDKSQLDMDFLDEQLDVIGAAFLGQTIGCARCHDHKFDPIPTRDYYALAGILKSSVGLKHSNVSEWIEQPLPLEPGEQEPLEQLEREQKSLADKVKQLKQKIDSMGSKKLKLIRPEQLPGVVVDSAQATLVGKWIESNHVGPIIGDTYLHDDNSEKGLKSATFEPALLAAGEYEVLLAYQAGENRATEVVVQVFSADGEREVVVNQQKPATEQNLWFSLGRYRFEPNGQKYVLVSNAMTKGHVILDAIWFLPVSEIKDGSLSTTLQMAMAEPGNSAPANEKVKDQLKEFEKQLAEVQKQVDSRPKFMTIVESPKANDLRIHIRGDVHSLGESVPRGFLSAVKLSSSRAMFPQGSVEATKDTSSSEEDAATKLPPTRLELANWIADQRNPLTARVYANRVWSWLMGRGIVSTPNNFGTTGAKPSHPELLDWMAVRFIESNWSTKTLVREIVLSQTYRRGLIAPSQVAQQVDPDNALYWRGNMRRISVEALRDAMLQVSGELDCSLGGSIIRPGTKADYNYSHQSTRRSIYQPVFRNSLPQLFDEFDFADPSVSIEARNRSTVAPQALALVQEPWVVDRCKKASVKFAAVIQEHGVLAGLDQLYRSALARSPSEQEVSMALDFLKLNQLSSDRSKANISTTDANQVEDDKKAGLTGTIDQERLALLIQAVFASVDFRYID